MEWLINLFTTGGGVAHTVILYALVISLGVFLGNKIKVGGISLGVTWILFVGILAGDLLMRGNIKENTEVITFIQDFGLILFVFSIGLQVGPSFFTALKQVGYKGAFAIEREAGTTRAADIATAAARFAAQFGPA